MDSLVAQSPGTAFAPAVQPRGDFVDPTAFARANADGTSRLELAVQGARCAGCISKIEGAMTTLPGVTGARLNLASKKLTVTWRTGELAPVAIAHALRGLGYHATPFDAGTEAARQKGEERFLLRCLAVAAAATMNVMLLSVSLWAGADEMGNGLKGILTWLSALIALPALAYAGRPFFGSAYRALRAGHVNMDVPITLALLLSSGLSLFEAIVGHGETYFEAAVMLMFLLLIGRYLDCRLRGEARSAARRLAALQVAVASRIEADGTVVAVPAQTIVPGDRVLVGPGERIAINGTVIEGRSTLDASLITGETAPVEIAPGVSVYSGALNISQPIVVRASAAREDSLLAEVSRLVEAGEQTRSRYVRLADRAVRLYVPVVHGLAFATLIGWLLIAGAGLHIALTHAIAVLIITCPCALGLAVPAVQIVATGRLFDAGVLVKTGDALERLAEADMVVFDKTGTLTLPDTLALDDTSCDPKDLELAATLARASLHPLARALATAAGPGPIAGNVHETPGSGLEAIIDGTRVRLGGRHWCGVADDANEGPELWLAAGSQTPVRFAFRDKMRRDAAQTVSGLKARGLTPMLLSGDRARPVEALAEAAGIDRWTADARPRAKHDMLDTLRARGHRVLMVGDGLNDAPALASAHVSLSPANAIDASQAAADYVLQGDDLAPILDAVDVARAARRRALENLWLSAAYNLFAVPLAVAGFVNPLIAAAAMSASSLIVTLNALRLIRAKARPA